MHKVENEREKKKQRLLIRNSTNLKHTEAIHERDIRPAGDGKFPFFYAVFNFRQMMFSVCSLVVANPHSDEFPNAVAMQRRAAVQNKKMRHTHDGVKGR